MKAEKEVQRWVVDSDTRLTPDIRRLARVVLALAEVKLGKDQSINETIARKIDADGVRTEPEP